MRTTVPVIVAFVTGLIMVVAFFFDDESTFVGRLTNELLNWIIIIGGFSLLLGMVSLFRVNLNAVRRRGNDWGYKILTIIAALAMAIPSVMPDSWSPLFGRADGSIYDWLFVKLQMPMMATMFATLAFYIASAAYRAFRARSVLATILLVAAVIVMIRFFPLGPLTGAVSWLSDWIINVPNLAAKRAILIGVGLGIVSTALKVILGIERSYLGRD